jgi:hypothetical protein
VVQSGIAAGRLTYLPFPALLRQTAAFISHVKPDRRKAHIVITKRLFSAAILLGVVCATALAQSSDPLVGTWKLNAEKSKGSKGGATKIDAVGSGVKFDVEVVAPDGTVSHWGFTANYDGKDNPVTGSSPYGNAVALTRVDAHTIQIASKQDGKPTVTSTIVLSADGKTRTTTTKGTDAKGQTVDTVSFYEKQ